MLSHRKIPRKLKTINQYPLVTPIYQSSTFVFPDTAALIDFQLGKRKGYLYTRYGNPTLTAVQEHLAKLEGAEQSLVLSSGMAAISTACLTLLKTGDELVSSFPLYGGTNKLFEGIFKRLGIKARYFPAGKIEQISRLFSPRTKLIYLESPTNPDLKIIDIRRISEIARKRRLPTIIDATFATPINQKPIQLGIDIVVHSATKYLGGHSDIIGGVISGKAGFIANAIETMKLLGGCADPHQAYLLGRGIKTLAVRMARHNDNALKVAQYLEADSRIIKVIYPGLKSHPQHRIAASQLSGFGGMVTFDLGAEKRAISFADSLKLVKNAVSLGGTESLVSLPIWTSHMGLDRRQLARAGVSPGLIRLSVGLEDPDLLIGDIRRALATAFKK